MPIAGPGPGHREVGEETIFVKGQKDKPRTAGRGCPAAVWTMETLVTGSPLAGGFETHRNTRVLGMKESFPSKRVRWVAGLWLPLGLLLRIQ